MVSLTTVSLLKERSSIFNFGIRSLRALSSMYSNLLWLTFNTCRLYSSLHRKKNRWRWFWDKSSVLSVSRLVEQSRKLSNSFPLRLRSVTSCKLIWVCILTKKSSFFSFRNERSICNANTFFFYYSRNTCAIERNSTILKSASRLIALHIYFCLPPLFLKMKRVQFSRNIILECEFSAFKSRKAIVPTRKWQNLKKW